MGMARMRRTEPLRSGFEARDWDGASVSRCSRSQIPWRRQRSSLVRGACCVTMGARCVNQHTRSPARRDFAYEWDKSRQGCRLTSAPIVFASWFVHPSQLARYGMTELSSHWQAVLFRSRLFPNDARCSTRHFASLSRLAKPCGLPTMTVVPTSITAGLGRCSVIAFLGPR